MINIIIVNYFSSEQVVKLVNQLSSEYLRFFIVDNSNDNPKTLMDLENSTYISAKSNLGYAGGNNYAFKYILENEIEGDIFILNPDVIISVVDILKMHKTLNSQACIGQVYCSAKNEKNEKIYDKISLNGLKQTWYTKNSGILESDYAAGSAMIINKKALTDNIFDERYFLYWEEVDLSLRIKKNGFKVLVDSDVFCIRESNPIHRQVKSMYYITRNALLINSKFKLVTTTQLFLFQAKQFLICLKMAYLLRSFMPVKYFCLGIQDAVNKKFGML